jgi:hypothetical protein
VCGALPKQYPPPPTTVPLFIAGAGAGSVVRIRRRGRGPRDLRTASYLYRSAHALGFTLPSDEGAWGARPTLFFKGIRESYKALSHNRELDH